MDSSNSSSVKLVILLVTFLILIVYYFPLQTNHYGLRKTLKTFYQTLNSTRILEMIIPVLTAANTNRTTMNNRKMNITVTTTMTTTVRTATTITTTTTTTVRTAATITTTTTVSTAATITTTTTVRTATTTMTTTITTTEKLMTTTTTGFPTTLDVAELLIERPPPVSRLYNKDFNSTSVAFLFQTQHYVLANLQLYLIRKFAVNLVAIELFTDGSASQEMIDVAHAHKAILHSFPYEHHRQNAGPSDRNTAVVNWAISTRAKHHLGNGSAILLLDGDVFPLSPFDSGTLLNGRDVVCRKHPALFARFCWIGFICIGPGLYHTIGDFNVSQSIRGGKAYDAGGKTVDYFLKYENTSFSWMKETILFLTDKELFWGAIDGDMKWIEQHFSRCDKCGPEIFVSPFNVSDAIFYHMISGTSEWRFGNQGPRRQALHDSIMKSPYGPNQQYSTSDMIASVKKIQKMELIPFFGNLTCERVCQG